MNRRAVACSASALMVALALAPTAPVRAAVPAPRIAQQTAPQDARDEAANAFARGEAAFDAGEFETAITQFETAQRLLPHDSTAFNLGLAQAAAGRLIEAWSTFDHLVESGTDPEVRDEAMTQRAAVEGRLSLLHVEAPPGVVVCLDGSPHPANEPVKVLPGTHEIVVGGHQRRVDLGPGQHFIVDLGDHRPRTASRASARRRRGLSAALGLTLGASAATVGTAVGGMVGPDRARPGLGYATIGLGSLTVIAAATALGLHLRPAASDDPRRRPATPEADCVAPSKPSA